MSSSIPHHPDTEMDNYTDLPPRPHLHHQPHHDESIHRKARDSGYAADPLERDSDPHGRPDSRDESGLRKIVHKLNPLHRSPSPSTQARPGISADQGPTSRDPPGSDRMPGRSARNANLPGEDNRTLTEKARDAIDPRRHVDDPTRPFEEGHKRGIIRPAENPALDSRIHTEGVRHVVHPDHHGHTSDLSKTGHVNVNPVSKLDHRETPVVAASAAEPYHVPHSLDPHRREVATVEDSLRETRLDNDNPFRSDVHSETSGVGAGVGAGVGSGNVLGPSQSRADSDKQSIGSRVKHKVGQVLPGGSSSSSSSSSSNDTNTHALGLQSSEHDRKGGVLGTTPAPATGGLHISNPSTVGSGPGYHPDVEGENYQPGYSIPPAERADLGRPKPHSEPEPVHATGFRAEGGDFDASRPGAGSEGRRLLDQVDKTGSSLDSGLQ